MYEPLVGVGGGGELVHLELIGPDMYDRAKTKAFLKFIADNADVISTGMRGANLCFYATNPGKNAKAYFCHEIWVRFDTVESSATPSFEGAMCSTGEAAPGNVIKLTLIFNLPSLLVDSPAAPLPLQDSYHSGSGYENSNFGLYTYTSTLEWFQYGRGNRSAYGA